LADSTSSHTNITGGMLASGRTATSTSVWATVAAANDPPEQCQNVNVLLGKILRIDINPPRDPVSRTCRATNPFYGSTPGRDEIFALGMRNHGASASIASPAANGLPTWVKEHGRKSTRDRVAGRGNYGWRVL